MIMAVKTDYHIRSGFASTIPNGGGGGASAIDEFRPFSFQSPGRRLSLRGYISISTRVRVRSSKVSLRRISFASPFTTSTSAGLNLELFLEAML